LVAIHYCFHLYASQLGEIEKKKVGERQAYMFMGLSKWIKMNIFDV
jgi:hypothetical protein